MDNQILSIEPDSFRPSRSEIKIAHNFGSETYYGNVSIRDDLAVGDVVEQGEEIGSTRPTSPNIWLRIGLIESGEFVDPTGIFPQLANEVLDHATE